MLPFKLGDSGLLGNIFQLALGFLELRLEAEGVILAVWHRRIVVRLRGVVWQGLVRGRRRGRIPLDEPEETKGIVRNGKNLEGIIREVDDPRLRRAPTRLPSASSLARHLLLLPAIRFIGVLVLEEEV
jgi:hypothetical protein